jgi:hypothetical protein
MSEGPSMETLMMLGAMAPKSEEEGKPTTDVPLTAREIQALAVFSNARFQSLFMLEGEDEQRMAAIYLGITSKLMMAALHVGLKEAFQPKEEEQ